MSAPPPDSGPLLEIHLRKRPAGCDFVRVEAIARTALPLCLSIARRLGGPLARLPALEVSIISSRSMARVHRDFLGIPGPTDVITFPYGEILVCPDVAAARAAGFGNSPTDELSLYIIHGFLHLAGHDDNDPVSAARMGRAQQRILEACRNNLC